jgi:hypothetical protein
VTHVPYRWFWIGAALWTIAVAIKVGIAIATNGPVYGSMQAALPYPLYLILGGLYGGLQSSFCEIGLTWLAVRKWPQLGQNADRAIGIGFGAGAFEAFLLGLGAAVAVAVAMSGLEGAKAVRDQFDMATETTAVFWLVGTAERIIAVLCHASSRALVLLGVVYRRPWMVFWGFAIFTILDGLGTAVHLTGRLGTFSLWWIELSILPMALISIPILRWCYSQWGRAQHAESSATPEPLPIS